VQQSTVGKIDYQALKPWQLIDIKCIKFFLCAVTEFFINFNTSNRLTKLCIFVVEGKGNAMTAKLITRISEHEWETEALFETHLNTMQGLERCH
jgi:hypothetical protein